MTTSFQDSVAEVLQNNGALDIDYEVKRHLSRLRHPAAEASQKIRNRRYRCMRELEREGDFFSDHQIQLRAPNLFRDYVGKLLPPELSVAAASERHCFDEETPLSERLMANLDEDLRSRKVAEAAAALERDEDEEEEEEEEDEDADDEEEVEASSRKESVDPPCARRDDRKRPVGQSSSSSGGDGNGGGIEDAAEEVEEHAAEEYVAAGMSILAQERREQKKMGGSSSSRDAGGGSSTSDSAARTDMAMDPMAAAANERLQARRKKLDQKVQRGREELLALMRERFLRGDEGEHFDYGSRCDNNPKFDDIEQESRDAEERWFDED